MIKRLSTTITELKTRVTAHAWARFAWYFLALLCLALYWAWSEGAEIAFVYNAF